MTLKTRLEYEIRWKVINAEDRYSHGNRYAARVRTASTIQEMRQIMQTVYQGFEYDKPQAFEDFTITKRWIVEDEISDEEKGFLRNT